MRAFLPSAETGAARRLAVPLLFRLSLAIWARLLPLLARRGSVQDLLRRTAPPPGAPWRGLAAPYIIRRVRRACRRPLLMRDRPCLREGLLAFRFLRRAGYRPVLHFGIDRTSIASARMAAHCWVSLDGVVLLNAPLPEHVEIQRVAADALPDHAGL